MRTAANAPGNPGTDCGDSAYYLQGMRSPSAYPARFRSHSLLLKQGLVAFKPSACNRRILISRPRPAVIAEPFNRRVSTWSLHRRNFDHLTYFEIREPVFLTGFSHPISNPISIRDLVTDIVEPPFTPISLDGVSALDWGFAPWRFKSESASQDWYSDGTDGGLLAGAPTIVAECTAVTPASSWNNARRGTECVGINGSLVLAQSAEARNGIVQWNVTLKGLHDSYQSVLEIHATVVLQVDDVIYIMEDHGRDPKLAYSPDLLMPQVTPCSLRYRFVGDLEAPSSWAAVQFIFSRASSYSGDTSILTLDQSGNCMQSPPAGGMEVRGNGPCRNLTLRIHPDASGSLGVNFTTRLGSSEYPYEVQLEVTPANDEPSFRFNCTNPVRRIAAGAADAADTVAIGQCEASCGNAASSNGEGLCQDFQNWFDAATPWLGCNKYRQDPSLCTEASNEFSSNCGIKATDACCICGGGRRNLPLFDARDCSMSISAYQMTIAASLTDSGNANTSTCRGVQIEQAAVEITAALWHAADEAQQRVFFELVPLFANYSRVFSPDALPSIDAASGTLTICLESGKTFGSVPFDVYLYDDGATADGGINYYGPARLNLEILSTNQEPSFDLCCGPILHVVESSGHHYLENFVTNIAKGERDQEGVDLESLQDFTFAVNVLASSTQAFTISPRVHVNPCAPFQSIPCTAVC